MPLGRHAGPCCERRPSAAAPTTPGRSGAVAGARGRPGRADLGLEQQTYAAPPPAAAPAPAAGGMAPDAIEQLKQLGALHEQGVLTDEEFSAQKAKVLGRPRMLATSSVQGGPLSYALLFACALVGWAGVPAIGTAAIGTTAVLASQGQMSIVAVLVVASAGAIAGGLVGYAVGHRWGVSAMERPGRRVEQRRRALAKGEGLYDRWGWVAVFFTPSWMAGSHPCATRCSCRSTPWRPCCSSWRRASGLRRRKISTGHTDTTSIAALVGGLALAVALALLFLHHRRRRAAAIAAMAAPPYTADGHPMGMMTPPAPDTSMGSPPAAGPRPPGPCGPQEDRTCSDDSGASRAGPAGAAGA